jgi:hypothetical protein
MNDWQLGNMDRVKEHMIEEKIRDDARNLSSDLDRAARHKEALHQAKLARKAEREQNGGFWQRLRKRVRG